MKRSEESDLKLRTWLQRTMNFFNVVWNLACSAGHAFFHFQL